MNRTMVVGLALSAGGVAAYVVGIEIAYPGRSFAVTAVMVGMTLVATGRAGDGDGWSP
jgi:hypothetical protein